MSNTTESEAARKGAASRLLNQDYDKCRVALRVAIGPRASGIIPEPEHVADSEQPLRRYAPTARVAQPDPDEGDVLDAFDHELVWADEPAPELEPAVAVACVLAGDKLEVL